MWKASLKRDIGVTVRHRIACYIWHQQRNTSLRYLVSKGQARILTAQIAELRMPSSINENKQMPTAAWTNMLCNAVVGNAAAANQTTS